MFMLNDLSCCPQTLNAHISLPHAHIATCTCMQYPVVPGKKYHPTPSQLLLYTYSDHGIHAQLKINDYFNNGFVTGVASILAISSML